MANKIIYKKKINKSKNPISLIKSELSVEQWSGVLKDEYGIVWQYDVQSLCQ